jgi:hypothetical protein
MIRSQKSKPAVSMGVAGFLRLNRETMSALGQKQTFALQQVMSALPPKADIGAAQINVRFVPIADIEGSKLDDWRSRPSKCRARPRTRDTDSLVYSSKLNVWVDSPSAVPIPSSPNQSVRCPKQRSHLQC